MQRCSSIWGHKFMPRYDKKPTNEVLGPLMAVVAKINLSEYLAHEMAVSQTYVQDVCVKCGATVERK